MPNFTINEETIRTITRFSKIITLEAGKKLTDDADLVNIAGKTVPAGYKITVRVNIRAENIEKI